MAQKYSIQLLTATTARWNESEYVIPEGELIAELQTDGKIQLKIGDGLHKFSDIPYVADKGPKGDMGASPEISVSKEDGVATVTITDASGEHSFQVNDGVSPTVNATRVDNGIMIEVTDGNGIHTTTLKDGDKGDPFTFADLTNEQKLELKGDTGEGFAIKGTYDTLELLQAGVPTPNIGDAYGVGTVAPYDVYIYDGVKSEWVNHGQIKGAKGDTGTVFTPTVSTNGDLSWSNNGGLSNPATVNIKGATGVGIAGIVRTTGDGSPGTTDTYTITYTNNAISTFKITNGAIQDISGKLDKSGDTMSGALILSGTPIEDLEAVTKKYVDDLIGDVDAAVTAINNVIGGVS